MIKSFMKNRIEIRILILVIAILVAAVSGGITSTGLSDAQPTVAQAKAKTLSVKKIKKKLKKTAPKTVGVKAEGEKAYLVLNNNKPYFKKSWLKAKSFEYYSPLDELGRCGTSFACVGVDIMPTEERESIGNVKPTGWHTVKYDRSIISDLYLYNRCHLLGYQLTGENANTKNLITGTRYLNVAGMLPFEDAVADAVKNKGVHVLYRVTPIFSGNNLVADGVVMEAMSCEDEGKTLAFCVFCPNIQPGIIINYSNGDSLVDTSYSGSAGNGDNASATNDKNVEIRYILNTNSNKFHYPDCSGVKNMAEHNKKVSSATRDVIIEQGFSPCGICKP